MGTGGNDWNPGKGFSDFSGDITGSFRNGVFGTDKMAASAQAAAAEQQATAKSQQAAALDESRKYQTNMNALADMSPQQMSQHGQMLQAASKNLQQRQKMFDSIDPALMEASKQVLNLLQGGASASTPARSAQREQLVNQLRSQYGPGAENTSAGQQALQQFDMGTLGARNQDLGTLMGVGQYGNQLASGVDQGIGTLGGAQQQLMGAQTAGTNSVLGSMMGTNGAVLGGSGASEVANQINYGAQKGFWDNWAQSSMKFGEAFGGAGVGGSMGGKGGGGGGAGSVPNDGGNIFSGGFGNRNTGRGGYNLG